MTEITYGELYKEFCEWSPEHAKLIIDYRHWGNMSIVVWLNNGMAYKVKRVDTNHFIMQVVSEEDIKKKYGLDK